MPAESAPTLLETANAVAAPAAASAATWWSDVGAGSETDFFASWLRRQCETQLGARAGIVLRPVTRGGMGVAASWPAKRPPAPELSRIAERAALSNSPLIAWAKRPAGKEGFDLLIGLSVHLAGALVAVIGIAIEVPGGIDSIDPDAAADRLRLGSGWLEARLERQRAESAVAQTGRAAVAMDIVAVASGQRRLTRAAAAVVNELAIRLRCDRVSLGLTRRGGIKLRGMSHTASFQERGRVVDAIENAMEECLAQSAPVAHPPTGDTSGRISMAHRDLAAIGAEATSVASIVLPGPDGPVGVLTFERHGEVAAFDTETLLLGEAAGALLGPVLRTQVANDRVFAGRVVDTLHDTLTTLLGREKPSWKLALIVAVAALTGVSVVTGEYRVTARAVLEGEIQRAAVAPFDGFVATSAVRPGDRLRAGDVLAALDDKDLVLDRARAWADVEKLRQKYSEAMAKHDRPNIAILAAQIDQGEAQLALADEKLRRARIVSPIDGLLVSGDLSQVLGSPVERGKTLFEIAPLDQYRVALRVDERELRFVSLGQNAQLLLAGMPGDRRAFTINRITPIAEAKDGRNEFRVEGTLTEPPGLTLRPGMEGVAKIETGSHRLIWVWTHSIIEWFRLTAWKWMP
jgi:multidrug efflux pump subunit AcrA (membrane-fusion protein)